MTQPPSVLVSDLFQLVGPEDYTPDYVDELNRKDQATLIRTVGQFAMIPAAFDGQSSAQRLTRVAYKAAIFVAGDREIDDGITADPTQFDIVAGNEFARFCRDKSPLHIFWGKYFIWSQDAGADYGDYWVPPTVSGFEPWDITVRRKLQGDDALFLLVNSLTFTVGWETEIAVTIDVESRNLLHD